MNQSSPPTSKIFSVLDNFGTDVGVTLSDLATDWEADPVQDPKEGIRSEAQANESHDDASDDFGKRLAKPLSFYNPVYNMVNRDKLQEKVKRPTLIPLSQLNGGGNKSDGAKTKKGGKEKIKKPGQRKSGFMSKLTAAARRHSHSNLKPTHEEPYVSPVITQTKRQSVESHNSSDLSTSSNLPSPHHTAASPSPMVAKNVVELKKPEKTPPVKSPRMSKLLLDESDNASSKTASHVADVNGSNLEHLKNTPDNTAVERVSPEHSAGSAGAEVIKSDSPKHEPPVSDAGTDLKTNPDPIKEASESPSPVLDSLPEATSESRHSPVKITESGSVGHGSVHSLSSLSEDGSPSDTDVRTMEEVIGEVFEDDTSQVKEIEEAPLAPEVDDVTSGRLKRDRTLRWTGTRKAPALMKEFTRKNVLAMPSDVASSNEELDTIGKKPKLPITPIASRSCTPSQQTTSFGMTEDTDAIPDGNNNKDDLSGQENSADDLSAFSPTKANSQTLLPTPEPRKSPTKRDSTFVVLSSLLPPAPKLRRTQSSKIRAYLQKLGTNINNALGYAVTQFVEETGKNKEKRPLVLLHDVRSFLSDIKHYLVTNSQIGLRKKIEKIVTRPSSVDIDGAVDDALDRLVLYPLHGTIYRCLVLNYKQSGQLGIMQEAISLAKRKSTKELGIRKTVIPPDAEAMEVIKSHFVQLQRTYSPYFKLKELLAAVTKIYQNTKDLTVEDQSARNLGADDFLPLLVYSIVHCDFIAADIETQYMDGLLDPALLLGEGGYYLTTLISAIQVVTSIQRKEAALPNISDLQGFLKVGISPSGFHSSKNLDNKVPDEGVILHKTLHVPPAMTAQNLCQMISKKFNVTAPKDYFLHVVVNDVSHVLQPNDCPQLVKMDLLTQFPSTSFYFSFQHRDPSSDKTIDCEEANEENSNSPAHLEMTSSDGKEENCLQEVVDARPDIDPEGAGDEEKETPKSFGQENNEASAVAEPTVENVRESIKPVLGDDCGENDKTTLNAGEIPSSVAGVTDSSAYDDDTSAEQLLEDDVKAEHVALPTSQVSDPDDETVHEEKQDIEVDRSQQQLLMVGDQNETESQEEGNLASESIGKESDGAAVVEETVVDETVVNETVVDETVVDETVVDETVVDETVVDETAVDEAAVDETVVDETVVDENQSEAPEVDESRCSEDATSEASIENDIVAKNQVEEPSLGSIVSESDDLQASEEEAQMSGSDPEEVEEEQEVEVGFPATEQDVSEDTTPLSKSNSVVSTDGSRASVSSPEKVGLVGVIRLRSDESDESVKSLPSKKLDRNRDQSRDLTAGNSDDVFQIENVELQPAVDQVRKAHRRSMDDLVSPVSELNSSPFRKSPMIFPRSRRSESLSSGLTVDAHYSMSSKRISRLSRETVATLTEFFEGKAIEKSPLHKKKSLM